MPTKWEEALEHLIDALEAAERNPNEGRPPMSEVVAKLMQRGEEEGLT